MLQSQKRVLGTKTIDRTTVLTVVERMLLSGFSALFSDDYPDYVFLYHVHYLPSTICSPYAYTSVTSTIFHTGTISLRFKLVPATLNSVGPYGIDKFALTEAKPHYGPIRNSQI